MSFRIRLLLALLAALLLTALLPVAISNVLAQRTASDRLFQIERQDLQEAISRVSLGFDDARRDFLQLLLEYANWDELRERTTVDAVDIAWFQENFGPEGPASLLNNRNLSFVVIWSKPDTAPVYATSETDPVVAQLAVPLLGVWRTAEDFTSIERVGGSIYLVAMSRIRDNQGENPDGLILIGRPVGQDEANRVRSYALSDVAMYRSTALIAATTTEQVTTPDKVLRYTLANQETLEIGSGGFSVAYKPLQDNSGQPVMTVVLWRSRDQINTAQAALNAGTAVGTIVAVIAALLGAALLGIVLARPIESLAHAATRFARGDFNQRIKIRRQDEVGKIGATLNNMAERLSRYERESEMETRRVQSIYEQRLSLFKAVATAFQNPLIQIYNLTQSLHLEMYGALNEVQRETVASIRHIVNQQGAILKDLMDYAQADSKQLRIVRQRVSLADIAGEVAGNLADRFTEKNIQLIINLADDLPALFTDRVRLERVLEQLLAWAARLTVPNGEVIFRADRQGGDVHITVSDTSGGLRPEEQQRIFDLFFYPEGWSGETAEQTAVGIGLALAKALIEQQNGTMGIEVLPGKGNTFHITLPAST